MGQHEPLDPQERALAPRVKRAISRAAKMVTQPLFISDRFANMDRTELLREVRRLAREVEAGQDPAGLEKLVADLQTHQEELHAQSQELVASRQEDALSRDRYADLYDYAPFGYVTLDPFGIIKEINLTGTQLLGGERARMLGNPLTMYVAHADRDRLLEHMRRCRKEPGGTVVSRLSLASAGRPTPLPVQLSSRAEAASPKLFRTAVMDLSDQVEAEEALGAAHIEIHKVQRLASLGTLAAGVAHEINNPLNAITMLAEYTATELPEGSPVRSAMQEIVGQAHRCAKIIQGMLKFARNEPTEKSAAQLLPVVTRSVEIARGYFPLGKLSVALDFPGRLPPVWMNELEIEQVLINLLKNAAQASPTAVHVWISGGYDTGRVRLTIRDDGPGIPPHVLPHIFDPFYSTRQGKGGTGLGLSISHSIITDHGGSIDVHSRIAEGTTLNIYLPIAEG